MKLRNFSSFPILSHKALQTNSLLSTTASILLGRFAVLYGCSGTAPSFEIRQINRFPGTALSLDFRPVSRCSGTALFLNSDHQPLLWNSSFEFWPINRCSGTALLLDSCQSTTSLFLNSGQSTAALERKDEQTVRLLLAGFTTRRQGLLRLQSCNATSGDNVESPHNASSDNVASQCGHMWPYNVWRSNAVSPTALQLQLSGLSSASGSFNPHFSAAAWIIYCPHCVF